MASSLAELQRRHRAEGRNMSVAMVEALSAAHRLNAGIAVSNHDIGPNIWAAAQADGITFYFLKAYDLVAQRRLADRM